MVYLMPGIKIYPTGNQGMAKYAIGPSLVLGAGQRTDYYYSMYYADPYYMNNNLIYAPADIKIKRDRMILGMMVNQSINISPTPRLYLGSEFGFGFTYINNLDGKRDGTIPLVQFSFKVGYKF